MTAHTAVPASSWPDSLQGLAEVIGEGATAKLQSAYSGRRVYIPIRRPGGDHPLAELLGSGELARLVDDRGGDYIEVPTLRGRGRLREAVLADNRPTSEVAKALGCSRRYVRRLRAEARA